MRVLMAALLLTLPLLSQAADSLGRLFTTPSERAGLDYLRQTSKLPERALPGEEDRMPAEADSAIASAPPAPVTVQGYVKRTDGKGTVWVNHLPVPEKTGKGDIEVGKLSSKHNRVTVKLPGSGQTVELKAGQTYDPVSGKIVEHARDIPVPVTPETSPPASAESSAPATR